MAGPLDPLRQLWGALQQAPQLVRRSLPNKDFAKGVGLGLTADVLGAPVDMATMALRPFGYKHPAPYGGSDWVAGKLGAKPNASAQETLGRVAGGLASPDPTDLLKAITVFHGSPHLFEKFDLGKVGTGEGAQAYGHGLYFAEKEGVARDYQRRLGKVERTITYEGQPVLPLSPMTPKGMDQAAKWQLAINHGKFDLAEADLRRMARTASIGGRTPLSEAYLRTADHMRTLDPKLAQMKETRGHLYEVDLPDEQVAKFLDWDKPFSEQPSQVRGALADMAPDQARVDRAQQAYLDAYKRWENTTSATPPEELKRLVAEAERTYGEWGLLRDMTDIGGREMYQRLQRARLSNAGAIPQWAQLGRSAADASAYLRGQDIPGIRYLDAMSRRPGEGTSNFVVFDDQIPRILRRVP